MFFFLFMSLGRGKCCFEEYFVSVLSITVNQMTEMLASPVMTSRPAPWRFWLPQFFPQLVLTKASVDALAVPLIISDIPNTFDMRRNVYIFAPDNDKGARTKDACSAW